MCRLYGFRATKPTKIECTLVHAQNALIVEDYQDHSGTSHLNGWGLAVYHDGRLHPDDRRKQPLTMRVSAVLPAAPIPTQFWRTCGGRRSAEWLWRIPTRSATAVGRSCTTARSANFDEMRPKMLGDDAATPRSNPGPKPTASTSSIRFSRLMIQLRLGRCAKYFTKSSGRSLPGATKSIPPPAIGLNILLTDGERLAAPAGGARCITSSVPGFTTARSAVFRTFA